MTRLPLLWLKVWRDTVALGSTTLALQLLMGIGVGLFVVLAECRVNLIESYESFYAAHRFAAATVLLDTAPESLVNTARRIPGVTAATGRAVKDGTIILRDRPRRRVSGRFIGIASGSRPEINDLHINRGRYLSSRGDCLVEQQFFRVNELQLGDTLTASYLGRQHDFRVVGSVSSPEYLYPAPSKESQFASPTSFGVVFIDQDVAREWLGLGGQITELHVLCEPGSVANALEILKATGERYGLRSWWDQAGQPSNRLLQLDLQGFMAMSIFLPMLFMFASGLSLYSSLSRIVRLQTTIVGFLRASGVSAKQVLWHYMLQGGLVAGAGALPGAVIGHWVSIWLTTKYAAVINLPGCTAPVRLDLWVNGITSAMVIGILSALLPARTAAATAPAVAMRGDRQDEAHANSLSWVAALTARLPILTRIAVRALVRRPSRTLFAVGGLICGTAVLLSTLGLYTGVNSWIDEYLYGTRRYELDVGFIAEGGQSLAEAVGSMPGVYSVTRTCSAPVYLYGPRGTTTVQMTGIERGQQAMTLKDMAGRAPQIEVGEVMINHKMATRIGVEEGDPVRVQWAYSRRSRQIDAVMRVGAVLDSSLGTAAFAEYHDFKRQILSRIGPEAAYGAMIACSGERGQELRRQLERNDLVSGISSTKDIADEIDASMGMTYLFVGILLAFGAVLAGAVLHSVASVGILERLRELATLRSLGFTARATTYIAAVEMYAMAALALVFGLPLGTWLNDQYLALYETENTSFSGELPRWAYFVVVGIVLALVAFSMRSGLQRLRTMDLAQATKARE